MLYDLYGAPPPPGSLLESVFMILSKRRQEQELLRTRVLVEAMLAPHVEKKGSTLSEAFGDYADTLFPFLRHKRTKSSEDAKKALKQWTDRHALRVKPIWNAMKDGPAKKMQSRLRKGADRVAKLEHERKGKRSRRI